MSGPSRTVSPAVLKRALAVAYRLGREGTTGDINVGPISPQAAADLNRQVAIAWASGVAETERRLSALERAPVPKDPPR